MSTDCRWVASQLEELEGLLSEDLETRNRLRKHVTDCPSCRAELEGEEKLDRLLRAYVHRKTAVAIEGSRPRLRTLRLAMAGTGLAVAMLAVWLVAGGGVAMSPRDIVEDDVLKSDDSEDALLAKPDLASSDVPPEATPPGTDGATSEGLYVTDAAGYFYSLSDFSDAVLILGVFDREAAGVAGFERLSESYRYAAGVRLLAVSLDPELTAAELDFPMMTNRGSTLLDTSPGQFSIIGTDGRVHLRGSLDGDEVEGRVAAALDTLGVQVP